MPSEKRTALSNGNPSGPMTELEVITSDDLLDLGKARKSRNTENPRDEEDTPMLKSQQGADNHDELESSPHSTEEVQDSKSDVRDTNNTTSNNPNTDNTDSSKGDKTQEQSEDSDIKPLTSSDNLAAKEPSIEYGIESSALLNEVGKLLEAKHVSFDSDQKTTL